MADKIKEIRNPANATIILMPEDMATISKPAGTIVDVLPISEPMGGGMVIFDFIDVEDTIEEARAEIVKMEAQFKDGTKIKNKIVKIKDAGDRVGAAMVKDIFMSTTESYVVDEEMVE